MEQSKDFLEKLKTKKHSSPYKRTAKLMSKLSDIVNDTITADSRADAMDILNRCTMKTIMEFLFFSASSDGNLTCLCLDFAIDEKGNKLSNVSFGNNNFYETETTEQ